MGSKVTDASDNVTAGADGTKSLIVYFSRMGEIPGEPDAVSSATVSSNSEISGSDTEAAAQMIRQITGADMYQIKTNRYYRKSFMGTAARAWIENTLNMRPALAAKPENLDQYDTIYVIQSGGLMHLWRLDLFWKVMIFQEKQSYHSVPVRITELMLAWTI